MGDAPLMRDEFVTHVKYLREDIKGVHTRLDTLNGRTSAAEQSIAVINDRADRAKKDGAKWGGAAGGLVVIIEVLRHMFWGQR